MNVLDRFGFEPGALYIGNRGNLDFERLFALHQAVVLFVTRGKRGVDARRVCSIASDRATGPICDQRILLNGPYSAKRLAEHLLRISYRDLEAGKALVFLISDSAPPALRAW